MRVRVSLPGHTSRHKLGVLRSNRRLPKSRYSTHNILFTFSYDILPVTVLYTEHIIHLVILLPESPYYDGSSSAQPVCDVRCAPAGKSGLERFTMVYGRFRGMPRVPAEPISFRLLDIYGLHGSQHRSPGRMGVIATLHITRRKICHV